MQRYKKNRTYATIYKKKLGSCRALRSVAFICRVGQKRGQGKLRSVADLTGNRAAELTEKRAVNSTGNVVWKIAFCIRQSNPLNKAACLTQNQTADGRQ